MASVAERVTRGAALLDERRPGWWREDAAYSVDLDKLDIDDCTACVLGQLYRSNADPLGAYDEGIDQLDIFSRGEAATYGFISQDGTLEESWRIENERLRHEWALLIAARRDAARGVTANG